MRALFPNKWPETRIFGLFCVAMRRYNSTSLIAYICGLMQALLKRVVNHPEWQRLARVASSSAILSGANVVNMLLLLLTVPLIIDGVGIAGYGIVVAVQAFAALVARLFDAQAWQVYIRLVGLGYDKPTALRIGLGLDGVALLGIGLAAVTADVFMQRWQTQYIPFDVAALLAFSTLNQCVFSWVGVLRSEQKFATLALAICIPAAFRLLALVALSTIMGTLSLRVVAWVFALTELFRFIYTVCGAWQIVPLRRSACARSFSVAWREIRHFTVWNWLMNLVDVPVQYLDSLLVGRLLSIEIVGVYGVLKRVGGVFSQLAAPLAQVIFPEVTRLVNVRNVSACQQLLWRVAVVMFGCGVMGMMVLFLSRTVWMPWFGLPFQYSVELFAFMICQIVGLAFTVVHPLMVALGLVRAGFYVVLCSNIIFLGLLYTLSLQYGLMGAIMAMWIQFVLVIGAKLGWIQRDLCQMMRRV